MPTAPFNSKCAELGCKNQRSKLNSYCAEHGGKDTTDREYDSIYSTPAWKAMRLAHLSKQPLCQACLSEGRIVSGKHVDHVFPWRKIGKEAFYKATLQTLCHEHHSHKTGLENQGICRHYSAEGHKDYAIGDWSQICARK